MGLTLVSGFGGFHGLITPPEVSQLAPDKLPGPNRKPDRRPIPPFLRGELLNFGGCKGVLTIGFPY